MYEGRTNVEHGKVLGHENMGIVEEIGPACFFVKKGDRVSVPFNIACGSCRNCQEGWTSYCTSMNPTEGVDGAAYGYANVGPYRGGQAEFLRVPHADFNLLQLPEGNEHENDFAMLSDIFPTGYHGTVLAEVGPGDSVAVFGAGPVGLMAAQCIHPRSGASVRGRQAARPARARGEDRRLFSNGDPVEQITEANKGEVEAPDGYSNFDERNDG